MRTNSEGYKMTPFESVLKYFEFLMALLYLLTGAAILWKAEELFNIPQHYALPIGILLIVYGVFRGVRVYQKYFKGD